MKQKIDKQNVGINFKKLCTPGLVAGVTSVFVFISIEAFKSIGRFLASKIFKKTYEKICGKNKKVEKDGSD